MSHVNETEQYRIMSKGPADARFKFRHFTGAYPRNRLDADMTLARLQHESPGWEFRIEARRVTQHVGDWRKA